MEIAKSILLLTISLLSGVGFCQNNEGVGLKDYSKVQPKYNYIPAGKTKLTRGILYERYSKNIKNLYKKIDEKKLAHVFTEMHGEGFAEPEFVGQYLAMGPMLYEATGDKEIYNRNQSLVAAVIAGQRKDGYLGTYHQGLEFSSFSVWNQSFMIKGLINYYEMTKDEDALASATKSADYVSNAYLNTDTLNLTNAVNEGIQNATILDGILHLYRITGKKLYLDFANFIIQKLEASNIKPIFIPNNGNFENVTLLGCTKGVEMLITYMGILEMYRITGEEKYLHASKNYWEALKLTQIGITGNGTIRENWNFIGNTPVEMDSNSSWHGLSPNENCVAVSWMQFCAGLIRFSADSKYFDEFEKTLYNHLIGSQAIDGHDFSYYQGNVGCKIHDTNGPYSCCRYRGMKMFAYLPEYIYMQSKDEIVVNVYTPSTTDVLMNDVSVKISQTTEYPRNGKVELQVNPEKNTSFKLLLRQPGWCQNATVSVDGVTKKCKVENGYLVIDNNWKAQGVNVTLTLDIQPEFERALIYKHRVAGKYGPLILAIDSKYGTPIASTMIKRGAIPILDNSLNTIEFAPIIKLQVDGQVDGKSQKVTLVDYASAGSFNPKVDEFRVWIPTF